MAGAKRRGAKAFVFPRIFLVSDPQLLAIQQADHRGKNRIAFQLSPFEVPLDPSAKSRQRGAEFTAPLIFGCIAFQPIIGVIAILLPPPRIAAGRLKMSVGILAEPCIFVGRRKRDRVQPIDLGAVRDPLAKFIEIGPGTPFLLTAITRLVVGAMTQHPFGALPRWSRLKGYGA